MRDLQEETLLTRAKQGDRDAFGELIRRYEKQILALTRRLCRNPEDGAEAAQEAFLAAWQGLPAFRGEARFSTWLYRLASNASVDLLRRESRRPPESSLEDERFRLPDRGPSPQDTAERGELREQIEAALRVLSSEHRQVILLREMHQLSYEEIAQALDLDLGTVKSRLNRAREKLRGILLANGNFSAPSASKKAAEKAEKEVANEDKRRQVRGPAGRVDRRGTDGRRG